jgi:hypothetical protein
VYPWYEDTDVAFDPNLAGTWVGNGDDEKECVITVTADPKRQVRHYNVELSSPTCADLKPELAQLSGGAQLLQVGGQRFIDIWDDDFDGLHTLGKIELNGQTLSVVLMTPDSIEDLMRHEKLQARVESGHDSIGIPDDVLITTPTSALRKLLRKHAEDKRLFLPEEALQFHRQ